PGADVRSRPHARLQTRAEPLRPHDRGPRRPRRVGRASGADPAGPRARARRRQAGARQRPHRRQRLPQGRHLGVTGGDRTAGILIFGNEILSGKVVDTNSPFLTRELRALGVTVRRILTIPDELDEIAAAVAEFHVNYEVVFTSGGVGPTHDDVTIEGVA